jgi:hypothetical protein
LKTTARSVRSIGLKDVLVAAAAFVGAQLLSARIMAAVPRKNSIERRWFAGRRRPWVVIVILLDRVAFGGS